MERKHVIAYDIRDPDRLIKVAKVMENYGIRVQKSIFEVALTPNTMRALKHDLMKVLDPDADGVKFFLICPKCEQKVNVIGKGVSTDLFQEVVIV